MNTQFAHIKHPSSKEMDQSIDKACSASISGSYVLNDEVWFKTTVRTSY